LKDAKEKVPNPSALWMMMKYQQVMMFQGANVTAANDDDFEQSTEEDSSEGDEPDEEVELMQGPRASRGQIPGKLKALHDCALAGVEVDDEWEAAVVDEHLSSDASDMSEDTDGAGAETEQSEELYDDSTESPDTTFKTVSASDSESIESDENADNDQAPKPYDPFDMTDLAAALSDRGDMTPEDINTWSMQSVDLLKAILRSEEAEMEQTMFGTMVVDSQAEVPYVLLMIDGGTFKHMIGTNAMQFMTNVRKVRPYPIKTAGGIVWLDTVADLVVSGHVFKDCLVNANIDTSLLSQGMMAMKEGWEFVHALRVGGLQITDPTGQVEMAHPRGMLSYLPSALLGERVMACEAFDQSRTEAMTDDEAAQYWQESQMGSFAADEATAQALADAELEEHVLKCHSTKLKLSQCTHCFKGKFRAFRAMTGGADKERLETLNADTIVMKVKSVNGNTDAYHGVMTRSRYGVLDPNSSKSSAATAKSHLMAKHEIESMTDPGGTQGYKIQRSHTDHGTEFEGEHKAVVMRDNIVITKTLKGSHMENAFIEQENGAVETMAGAVASVGIPTEAMVEQVWDELYVHCRRCRNHLPITAEQKSGGYSPAEEQMEVMGASAEWFKGMQGMSFGQGMYAFTRKFLRDSKLSWHAIECIFVGRDVAVSGAVRAMPFKRVGDGVVFGKTIVVKKFTPLIGAREYPLMQDDALSKVYEDTKADVTKWKSIFESLGFKGVEWYSAWDAKGAGAEGSDDSELEELELKVITDHVLETESEEGVVAEYECEWKGYPDPKDRTWHEASTLLHAKGLVRDYHEANPELVMPEGFEGDSDSDSDSGSDEESDADPVMAVTEGDLDVMSTKECNCDTECAPKYSDTAHGSHGFECAVWYKRYQEASERLKQRWGPVLEEKSMSPTNADGNAAWVQSIMAVGGIAPMAVPAENAPTEGHDDCQSLDWTSVCLAAQKVKEEIRQKRNFERSEESDDIDFDLTNDVDFDLGQSDQPNKETLWERLPESCRHILFDQAFVCKGHSTVNEVFVADMIADDSEVPDGVFVVEVPWKECALEKNIQHVRTAKKREDDTMREMRLTSLTQQEIDRLTPQEIKSMPEFRYSITRRRPTPEEVALGEADGEWKARIVSKDLKCRFKKPVENTHSKVPSTSDFRLLVASTNLIDFEVWASDFKCAYLQSFKWARREWRVIKLWDPDTQQWGYFTCCGVVYGDQEGAAEWKNTLTTRLLEMGFVEIQNAESMYYHKAWGIRMSVHVDDPFMTFDKSVPDYAKVRDNFMALMEDKFVLKGWKQLLPGVELDYLSMRVTAGEDGSIRVDNDRFVNKLLDKYGMQDCNPTVRPMTRELLQMLQQEQDAEQLTDDEGQKRHQAAIGEFVWLGQTTHPGIAVAVSMLGSFNAKTPVSYDKAIKVVLRWLKGTLGDALVSSATDKSGLEWTSDSDWAGLHGITGATYSRGGRIAKYNGMPWHWHTGSIGIRQSSAEAEAFAMSECVKAAQHTSFVMDELGIPGPTTIEIGVDATAAMGFANNTSNASRMKHIDVRCDWVILLRDRGVVKFIKVPGDVNPSDFMTKILSGPQFAKQNGRLVCRVKHVGD
jgi:hypothetical protein